MTARTDERDPAEPADWIPTSRAWSRRQALEAAEAAVRAAKDKRKQPTEESA